MWPLLIHTIKVNSYKLFENQITKPKNAGKNLIYQWILSKHWCFIKQIYITTTLLHLLNAFTAAWSVTIPCRRFYVKIDEILSEKISSKCSILDELFLLLSYKITPQRYENEDVS